MYITKNIEQTMLFSTVITLFLSSPVSAQDMMQHDHSMHTQHEQIVDMSQAESKQQKNTRSFSSDSQQIHQHLHGNEIYQATTLQNQWLWNGTDHGLLQSELKSWIGTDENKLFIQGHLNKTESVQSHYDIALLYSHYLAEFWDIQIGFKYQNNLDLKQDDGLLVMGLHGLAPYFFETDLSFAVSDQQSQLNLETSRDFLFTQKLISQPYLNVTLILNDKQKIARKTGLSELQSGIQTRYEINKTVMPFVDISYRYDKGYKTWIDQDHAQDGMYYGLGLSLKF
ncbi:copper resistance protein B [Acinetobacter qingfengensis]|uniref:Uncharacterized protein n=1 Tax=Acinetobacter qingfengensis TaxID=1262585 RepID=A0A1E7R883_9GAMM|nr:copper resistance protein B [Acinetobacter qingfengensis]KAA8731429.1 copper resistance protein B [Acinetobacter qingfengensis]OEY95511.1 hypothetical protein BJI46_12810 [Acinetobacter qingfengensis]